MRMTVDNRTISLSLIGAIGLAVLTGCGTGLTREAMGEPRVEYMIRERVSTGTPTLSLIPHDDQLGWSISVTQPHTETRVIQETQDWETTRHVWFPPSFVLGLIKCPLGLLFPTITSDMLGADARDYGCQRLLMHEPVEGTVRTTTQENMREETVERTEPLRGGEVVYGWPETSLPAIRVKLDQLGHASLRLSHVLEPQSQSGIVTDSMKKDELRLEVSRHGTRLVTQKLPVTTEQMTRARKQARAPLPADRFPDRIVVTIKASDPAVQSLLEYWVLQRGWCLAAGSARHAMIVDELREQYSGRVAEVELVSLGKWVPPTTILEATLHHDEHSRRLTLRAADLNAGEALGTVTASGPLEEWGMLINQTTVDLDHLFRQAPRGCL